MKNIAVTVPPMTPRREFLRIARLASEMSYHSVWTYEEFHADPILRLAECLQQTDLRIGTGCLNPFLRTPLGIAMTYMTLEEMFPGRTILGLGVGVAFWLDRAGVNTKMTHSGVREGVQIIRELFRGETVNLDGRFFKVHDLKITLPPTPAIPIYLAPRENLTFAEICGEIGDGCFGPIGVPNRYLRKLFDHVRIGLTRSGRGEADYVFANNFCAVADRNPAAAKEAMFRHPWFAHALGIASNPEAWRECGLDTSLFEPYRQAEARCDWAETARLVWNTNAHRDFGLCGTREELAEQIQQKTALLGLDLPVLSVCAHNERQVIETLEGGRMYAEQG
jgi:alkanesulfonate monooxygenase SsuD/methylene tetrahydromethanopterin reductase-like flavin-dependent oxidoreductase (luciferase family)